MLPLYIISRILSLLLMYIYCGLLRSIDKSLGIFRSPKETLYDTSIDGRPSPALAEELYYKVGAEPVLKVSKKNMPYVVFHNSH